MEESGSDDDGWAEPPQARRRRRDTTEWAKTSVSVRAALHGPPLIIQFQRCHVLLPGGGEAG